MPLLPVILANSAHTTEIDQDFDTAIDIVTSTITTTRLLLVIEQIHVELRYIEISSSYSHYVENYETGGYGPGTVPDDVDSECAPKISMRAAVGSLCGSAAMIQYYGKPCIRDDDGDCPCATDSYYSNFVSEHSIRLDGSPGTLPRIFLDAIDTQMKKGETQTLYVPYEIYLLISNFRLEASLANIFSGDAVPEIVPAQKLVEENAHRAADSVGI